MFGDIGSSVLSIRRAAICQSYRGDIPRADHFKCCLERPPTIAEAGQTV